MVPPSIQICPVEIPGRGRRSGESAPADLDSLAETLLRSLPLQVPSPFRVLLNFLSHMVVACNF